MVIDDFFQLFPTTEASRFCISAIVLLPMSFLEWTKHRFIIGLLVMLNIGAYLKLIELN